MHQLIAVCGIAIFAYFLGVSIFEETLPLIFHRNYSIRYLQWSLTETPYFPIQIGLGFYFGWMLSRRLHHQSMLWVWVIPFLNLCYALLFVPTLTPGLTSVMVRAGANQSVLSHYFGWGCQPKDHCLDQLFTTMPLYVSAAYSVGALFGRVRLRPASTRA